jgi:hypothetical protein
MNNLNLSELSQMDLIQINGGVDEAAYNMGCKAGEVAGKMVRNFITMVGVWKLFLL